MTLEACLGGLCWYWTCFPLLNAVPSANTVMACTALHAKDIFMIRASDTGSAIWSVMGFVQFWFVKLVVELKESWKIRVD